MLLNLHRDKKPLTRTGARCEILSDRMLRIKGSAEYSRRACVDRPSRSADEQLHNNAPHRKCLRKKTTACASLLVLFRIRRGTFPYSVEDDAIITISQTPTTHYTNTCCVEVTIVTHLSFSERIAIANLIKLHRVFLPPLFHPPLRGSIQEAQSDSDDKEGRIERLFYVQNYKYKSTK